MTVEVNLFVEIWRKEVGNYLLIEYEDKQRILPCKIVFLPHDDYQFSFGSWGMNREDITEEMLTACCQAALDIDCNVALSSFYDNYLYFVEDDEDE